MEIIRTERFKKAYRKLPTEVQEAFKKQFRLFVARPHPPFHPSLRVHGVEGTIGVLEATVTMGYRMTFEFGSNSVVLRNIGRHDLALRRP